MKKTKTWKQLNQGDRDRIQLLWAAQAKQVEIAKVLAVDPSRISRELKRHRKKDGGYEATNADKRAKIARSNSKYQGMKIERQPELKTHIVKGLKRFRSPDEIAGRMIKEKWVSRVSTDAIYRWLRSAFGQRYCRYLCTKRSTKKTQTATKRQLIPNLTSIHDIPPNPGIKTEGDTMVSPHKVSRASAVLVGWPACKLLKGDRIKSLSPVHTTRVMKKIHQAHRSDLMILDRGIENTRHEQFGIPTYFCDPASPRQKPFIESSIGLSRRWFYPKGTNLALVSSEEFKEKIEILNNKYRKSLGYQSANERARETGILKDY